MQQGIKGLFDRLRPYSGPAMQYGTARNGGTTAQDKRRALKLRNRKRGK